MDAESDCIICPEGTFCPVGSAQAQPCAPGSYIAQAQQDRFIHRDLLALRFSDFEDQPSGGVELAPSEFAVHPAAVVLTAGTRIWSISDFSAYASTSIYMCIILRSISTNVGMLALNLAT